MSYLSNDIHRAKVEEYIHEDVYFVLNSVMDKVEEYSQKVTLLCDQTIETTERILNKSTDIGFGAETSDFPSINNLDLSQELFAELVPITSRSQLSIVEISNVIDDAHSADNIQLGVCSRQSLLDLDSEPFKTIDTLFSPQDSLSTVFDLQHEERQDSSASNYDYSFGVHDNVANLRTVHFSAASADFDVLEQLVRGFVLHCKSSLTAHRSSRVLM